MENNWPETIGELLAECQMLVSKTDLYELGERGEPFTGEVEPRVDGTDYLAGEYRYGVAMIPAQWVTHVLEAATLGSGECEVETTENWLPAERYHRCKNCGAFFAVMNATGDISPCVCPNCGRAVKR
jgi:hypothetical protein